MSLKKLNKLFRIKISTQKGVSLIELMIAVAILGAVAFGIFKSFQVGFWGMSDARARTIAVNLAQEKLEELKGKELNNIEEFEDPNSPIELSGKEFRVFYEVKDAEKSHSSLYSILKQITTTVKWQKRDGTETKIQVEGLQSKTEVSRDEPTSILLNIDPNKIIIGKEVKEAEITVTILDQDNFPIAFEGTIELTMDRDDLGTIDAVDGYLVFNGNISLQTTFKTNTEGHTGEVTITARDVKKDELIQDSKTITITGGKAEKINLEAEPNSIQVNGEESKITIEILDDEGNLAEKWTGEIELKITEDEDAGYLVDDNSSPGKEITVEFNEENVKTVKFISSNQAGNAKIEATDKKEKLESDEVTIDVTSGPPFKIGIVAVPNNVKIKDISDITVTILNKEGEAVSGFEGQISLSIIKGSDIGSLDKTKFEFHRTDVSDETFFIAGNKPGVVEIKAEYKSGNYPLQAGTETITVATGPPASIKIDADPKIILNNGSETSSITVTLKDSEGNDSSFDEDKVLSFSIVPDKGTLSSPSLTLPARHSSNDGMEVTYSCNDRDFEGDVTITVECVDCDGLIPGQDKVKVQKAPSVVIEPADEPNIRFGKKPYFIFWETDDKSKVLFDIEVLGGTVDVTQIDLAWIGSNRNRRLRGITIYEKGDTSNERIKKSWSSLSSSPYVEVYENLLPIESSGTWKSLEEEKEYTVELVFSSDVNNRTLFIQFHASYQGQTYIYGMELEIPN
jgi:prepilin-type N-terminal cleavage/methylation domain-containing protein